MKQNKFFILAAALAFVACSSDDNYTAKENASQAPQEVSFGAYLNRGVTRAGSAGVLTTSTDETTKLQVTGFGVFGYYTDGSLYNEEAKPNFMYNQQVNYSSTWSYTPIKYWPNEFGTNAASDDVDYLTFFAYAPYVSVNPSSGVVNGTSTSGTTGDDGKATYGITALTRNTAMGDPYAKYIASFDPTYSVDLCYGVAGAAFNTSVGTSPKNNITENSPFIDLVKPDISAKVNFKFLHALSKLNVLIDADVDDATHTNGSGAVDDNTRIYVRSVTFEGFAIQGALNLHTGEWYDQCCGNKLTSGISTVYDGRTDGKEGLSEATNESPKGLNPTIIQSDKYTATTASGTTYPYTTFSSTTEGVTKAEKNLFNSTTSTTPIFVIPTGENVKVTIVYDVETADATLPTYLSDGVTKGNTIQNAITKQISFGSSPAPAKLEAGKAYEIKLHLGMTSVKFEATVNDWGEATTGNGWLPENKAGSGS